MKIENQRIGKLQRAVLIRTILPMLVMCVIIDATAILRAKSSLQGELQRSLYATASAVAESYDEMYPGDYRLVQLGGNYVSLYKGETELTEQFAFLDRLREKSGMHISLFFKDARILTTLQDAQGNRYAGSAINAAVSSQMERKQTTLYYEVEIQGELYYACYIPLWNTDGALTGMVATALTSAEIKREAARASRPILLITLLGLLAASFISIRYTSRIVGAIGQIHQFLAGMVGGNLSNTMPDAVLKRRDEIGQTGSDIVRMQNAVRVLVECDPLTTLYNRRYGNAKLRNMQRRSAKTGAPFAIAIADIDFFKKVNDTYGHDAGDEVLKFVAGELKELMGGRGHAIRWGGEEFLLIFEDMQLINAGAALEEFVDRLHGLSVTYGPHTLRVTMTIGLVEGSPKSELEDLIKQADEKLYYGKEHGRDQLVVTMDGAQPCYRMLLVFQQDEKRGDTMITFSDEVLDSENPMQLFAEIAMREAEQESLAEEEEDAPPAEKNKDKDTEEKNDE
ncbi:MAG: diguanylate cyclase [Lachnospiraceae bacterium]|nr:diguanylate cyclase [Lachnospiraceae bacterium]